jgi:adenosylmethionine-8-amino-7-oxononanoate aminotransferase
LTGIDRARIVELDKARVWHPYTEMSRYRGEVDPFVIVEASGSRRTRWVHCDIRSGC